ncbi:MAG TPA: cytochrome c3 family protein, partial [Clostridia bacterium]|nr:cytochrome c3 family protein [Clostridia bacterium]
MVVLVGCSTQSKQKWLTFFFDGVPVPGSAATNGPPVQYDENGQPLLKTEHQQPSLPAAVKVQFTAHPPYDDQKCSECHLSKFSVMMKGTQQQVCFACHD